MMNSNLRRGAASKHPLYGTWNGIRQRCLNPDNSTYPRYGGRGIWMHEPWITDFWAFAEWIAENLGPRPEGHTLDRYPDVNGGYEPGNLRWATAFEQMTNTRSQLDPLNGIFPTGKDAGTWCYQIWRNGVLYAEYGFGTPEDAAAARDQVQAVIDAGEDALGYIQRRKGERQETWRLAREEAEKKAAEAKRLRDEAREEKRLAQELERATKQAARQDRKASRARRWHEMNKTMTLADIARAEGVSVAHVSIELKRHGYEATAHNATGYPGVKKVTRNGHTYFEARMVIDGKRKTLGQRKTPEEAHALYVAARATMTEDAS